MKRTVCDVNDDECTVGGKIVRGLCRCHLRRMQSHGSTAKPVRGPKPRPRRTVCDVNDDECTPGSVIVNGLCTKHRARMKKHGNTSTVLPPSGGPGHIHDGLGNPLRVPDETVARWRRLRARGWSGAEIAREYGVAPDTVYRRTNVTDGRRAPMMHTARERADIEPTTDRRRTSSWVPVDEAV